MDKHTLPTMNYDAALQCGRGKGGKAGGTKGGSRTSQRAHKDDAYARESGHKDYRAMRADISRSARDLRAKDRADTERSAAKFLRRFQKTGKT